jgi:hypothetical protein
MANHVLQPWHLLLTILAGIVNRAEISSWILAKPN